MMQSWEQDIRAREEENRVAFLAGDVAVLDRLWTDDFLVNSPLSLVNDKPRTLALLQAGRVRHSSLTVDIQQMACHGDVLVVVGRDRVTDRPEQIVSPRRRRNLARRHRASVRA